MRAALTCYFYTQYECVARCRFCDIWERHADPLPLRDRLPLLRELRDAGVRYIDFTGGEPLLCDDLPALLAEAKRVGLVTSVTSNCYLYPARHRELLGLVDYLAFSLNGATADTHDAVYGISCFESLLESIALTKQSRELLHLQTTVTRETVGELPALAELARVQRVPLVVFPEFAYFGNAELPDSCLPAIREAARWPNTFVNRASLAIAARGGNRTARPICRGVRGALAITPDGLLALPCFHRAQRFVPAAGRLAEALADREVIEAGTAQAGRQPFCEGCLNWCYLNPSLIGRPGRLGLLYAWSGIERYLAAARAAGLPLSSGLRLLRRPAGTPTPAG